MNCIKSKCATFIPVLSLNYDYIPNQPEYRKVPFIELKWPPENFSISPGEYVILMHQDYKTKKLNIIKKLLVHDIIGTRIIINSPPEFIGGFPPLTPPRTGVGIPRLPNWGSGATGYFLAY